MQESGLSHTQANLNASFKGRTDIYTAESIQKHAHNLFFNVVVWQDYSIVFCAVELFATIDYSKRA